MKTFQDFYPYSFNGLQTVEGQNYRFIAAAKGYKRYQTMNKDLISETIGHFKKKNNNNMGHISLN